jgi:hypothetical protein
MLPSVPDGPDGDDKQRHREAKKENIQDMWQRIWNTLFAQKAAAWTAVFTAVLTAFTYLLYQVSQQANDNSKEQARGFVNFAGLSIGPRFNDPQGKWVSQEIAITWANSGSTAAKAAVFKVNAKPFLDDLPTGYDFPLPSEKTEGVVPPKGTYAVNVQIPSSNLIDEWSNKGVRIFVWGSVLYKDIFPNDPERLTEFCTEITHVTAGFTNQPKVIAGQPPASPRLGDPDVAIVQFQFQACTRGAHTCYDEDCKDYSERVKDMR